MISLKNTHFIRTLKSLPFVDAVYLYGSRARGDFSERSDIDLAIECPRATERDWLEIVELVENADTLLGIDCVRLDVLDDDDPLKRNILKEQIRL